MNVGAKMKIYVTIFSGGQYEEKYERTVYVGEDFEEAKKRAETKIIPSDNRVFIEAWENGEELTVSKYLFVRRVNTGEKNAKNN
jgi:hypothetical protein